MGDGSNAHLNQWKHNRSFLETIPPDYPDWIVTVAFYTALHAVNALLAADKVRAVTSHDARNSVLMRTNKYKSIYQAYQPLYSLSRTVRYLADPKTWIPAERIEENVFKGYLYRIERSVFKLLGSDTETHVIVIPTSHDGVGEGPATPTQP